MEVHLTNYIKMEITSRDKIFTIGLWTITTLILILIFGLLDLYFIIRDYLRLHLVF